MMLRKFFQVSALFYGGTSTMTEKGLTLTFPLFTPKGESVPYSLTITAEGEVLSSPPPEGPLLWLSPRKDFSLLLILTSPLDAFIVEALCLEVKVIAGVSPEATLTALEAWNPLLCHLFKKVKALYLWEPEGFPFFTERFYALYQVSPFIIGEGLAPEFSSPFKIFTSRPYRVARDFIYHLLNTARSSISKSSPSQVTPLSPSNSTRYSEEVAPKSKNSAPFDSSPLFYPERETTKEGFWVYDDPLVGPSWALARCQCGEEVPAKRRERALFCFTCPSCGQSFMTSEIAFTPVFIAPWEMH